MTLINKPPSRRKKTNIINKARWAGYAAAGAATAMVGHEMAEAGITHVDPPDILVQATPTGNSMDSAVTAFASLDLNADGEPDFGFAHSATAEFGSFGAAYAIQTTNTYGTNMIGGFIGPPQPPMGVQFPYVYNLPASTTVSSANPMFLPSLGTLAFGGGYTYSQFKDPGPGFVGVKFNSAAGTHYGWIRVEMSGTPQNSLTITDWAYGMPGESIHVGSVPEPGSLGLLAFGAAGLLAWRRKRLQVAAETQQSANN